MPAINLGSTLLPCLRQPNGTVRLLLYQTGIAQDPDSLVDTGLRDSQMFSQVNGAGRDLLIAQFEYSFEVDFIGCRERIFRLHFSNLLASKA